MTHYKPDDFRVALASFLALVFLSATARAITPWSLVINTNNVITVTNATYGAIGDGIFTNTMAFQNAINAAAASGLTNALRGGTVHVPAGVFLCGPLTMKSNVRLQLDSGAVVRLLPRGSWPGSPYTGTVASLLTGSSITNIAVTGLGAFDGQGSPWWPDYKTINRPLILNFPSCSRVWLQDFTSSNPPVAHVVLKGNGGSINCIGIKLIAPSSDDPVNPSHNTDGVDFAETNAIFQDCIISTGDDNIAIGSSASVSKDILVTNCIFGEGHGLSIGSYTSGGVSNLTVMNCVFTNTGAGIKIKSSRDRGGVVQNLTYANLSMTNVDWPIQLYAYYEYGIGTLNTLTPAFAAGTAAATANPVPYQPPIYRDITISNVTANVPNGQTPLLLWGLPDHPISNVVFKAVNITSSSTKIAGIYNTTNIQFIDCSFTVPTGGKTFQLWNGNVIFTNSLLATNLLLLDGLTTNGIGNALKFYGARATVSNTNAIAGGAITLCDSTLTVSNNLTLTVASPLNFIVGTNPSSLVVRGNLTSGGTLNAAAGAGFTNGNFPLITYSGGFSGSAPTLGSVPVGYNCSLSTVTPGIISLVATVPVPAPASLNVVASNLSINLQWSPVAGATSYNVQRGLSSGSYSTVYSGLTVTNFTDVNVTNGVIYYYVVNAVMGSAVGTNSVEVSAVPLSSNQPTMLSVQSSNGFMEFTWPQDHLGWGLQVQTNDLGTNWVTVPNTTNITAVNLPIDPANGSVFFRLVNP
jgi:hypothetical protein